MVTLIEPFVKRNIFASEEEAIQEMVRGYVMRQVSELQAQISQFEAKYSMSYQQFRQYLRERSELLVKGDLSDEQRQILGKAVMVEEDDLLDWKVAREILENWLGLRQEIES
jgi:membrane-bound ClpP family serine protease